MAERTSIVQGNETAWREGAWKEARRGRGAAMDNGHRLLEGKADVRSCMLPRSQASRLNTLTVSDS